MLGDDLADPEAIDELGEGEELFFEKPPEDELEEDGAMGGRAAAEALVVPI